MLRENPRIFTISHVVSSCSSCILLFFFVFSVAVIVIFIAIMTAFNLLDNSTFLLVNLISKTRNFAFNLSLNSVSRFFLWSLSWSSRSSVCIDDSSPSYALSVLCIAFLSLLTNTTLDLCILTNQALAVCVQVRPLP